MVAEYRDKKAGLIVGGIFGAMTVAYAAPGFIYLLLVKRYFEKQNQGEDNG